MQILFIFLVVVFWAMVYFKLFKYLLKKHKLFLIVAIYILFRFFIFPESAENKPVPLKTKSPKKEILIDPSSEPVDSLTIK